MRRILAGFLSAALVALSPGLEPYGAMAATLAPKVQARAGVTVRPVAPSLPALPVSVLAPAAAPTLSAPAAVIAPAVAPTPLLQSVAPAVEAAVAELAKPAASAESAHSAGRRLDGTYRAAPQDEAAPAVVAAPAPKKRVSALKRWARSAALAVGLTLATVGGAQAQQAPVAPQPPAAEQIVVKKAPITASWAIEGQGRTVGETVRLRLTLRNDSSAAYAFSSLRTAVNDALPEDIELISGEEGPVTLQPGESREFVFDAKVWASGELELGGQAALGDETLELPPAKLEVATVLTPDWEDKGFKDIADVLSGDVPSLLWLAAIPMGLVLLWGVERLIAARRRYPKAAPDRLPLILETEQRLAALAQQNNEAAFYSELQATLTKFAVDFPGLKTAERDAAKLLADAKASKFYGTGQLQVLEELVRRAEAVRFGGAASTPAQRASDLRAAKLLVDHVAGKPLEGVGANAAVAGLSFANPWVLLALLPVVGLLGWRLWKTRPGAYSVASTANLPTAKSLRQKLWWLPRFLRAAAVASILIALAGPQLGVTRHDKVQPSTDTMFSLDLSGSMDEKFEGSNGPSKLEAARLAMTEVINENRRGTQNRIGLVTFSDNAYIDVRLTTDYDALIAHLKELKTTGSTAVGKGILTAIGHFAELNILEEQDTKDPRMKKVVELLRAEGLGAALDYAKDDKALMDKIIRPDKKKIVVAFTDGQSNSGITPVEAAEIAKGLGVRVYTVGIGGRQNAGGLDQATLVKVAEITGARYFRADDTQTMAEVLLEISRLEKSPAKIVSTVAVNDYSKWFILLALLALGFELGLVNTRLRTLHGIAFALALPIMGGPLATLPAPSAPIVQTQQVAAPQPGDILRLENMPAEAVEANRLYAQGRYDEALKLYARALERYPDMVELYYNMGNAYLKMGDVARAREAYQRFLSLTQDPALQSRALFNLGNAALMAKDAEAAKELYKESLRRNPNNADAKWNLEALNKKQQQQQQQQQQQNGKQNKKGQKNKQQQQQQGQQGQNQQQQNGQQQQQQGQPGEQQQKGDQEGQPKDGKEKSPGEKLAEKLGEQEKGEKEAARKGMTRKGNSMWGGLALGGTALTFGSSAYLWALAVAVPAVIGVIAWGWYKKHQAARALAPATAPKSFMSWWGRRTFMGKAAAVTLALGMLGLAASDPRSGYRDERLNFGGKDVMVTVDGSHSMVYAEDGRLDRTKKELAEFVSRLHGTDRIGLVVFAGQARTASPLSIDYGNFEYKIERLDTEARGLQEGSNLAEAIKHTAAHYETAKKVGDRKRVMIVISDGDITAGELQEAIAAAQKAGVIVYAIGVGTAEGTKMKVPTVDGEGAEYLMREDGSPAITKLNEQPLRELSERTGGSYFRADQGVTMTKLMERVAGLQKGEKGDSIRSPRPVGFIFLLPALLLLLGDLLIPARSLLKRETEPKKKDTTKLQGLGAAGLGLVPMAAWPQLLPFALGLLVIAGLFLYEVQTNGGLSNRVRWALGRRVKAVEKGVEQDLAALVEPREADEPALRRFLASWRKKPSRALVDEALDDDKLWREKLALAGLSGADAETEEALYGAFKLGQKRHLESMEPVVRRVAGLYSKLPWLSHVDAARRLGRMAVAAKLSDASVLAGLIAHPDVQASAAARDAAGLPAAAPAKARRLTRAAAMTGLVVALMATGLSGSMTVKYAEQQEQAAVAGLSLFYGPDAYVFNDVYADSRINEYVLPALRRWNQTGWAAKRDLERAVEVLRMSPDPKADNLLEAIFSRADLLPLTEDAENTLLLTLVERENDHVWRFLVQHLQQSAEDERAVARTIKMIGLASASAKEKVQQNIYYFLRSPNPQVQTAAVGAIMSSLMSEPAKFFDKLGAAQARFAADPVINLWVEIITLQRVAMGGADDAKARAMLDRVLVSLLRADEARLQLFNQLKPEDREKMPPAFAVSFAGVLGRALADGQASQQVKDISKYALNELAAALIKEGETAFESLHADLIKRGVVLPDEDSSYDDYDRGHGYYPSGGSGDSKRYRDSYKLSHLRALQEAVDAQLGALGDKATVGQLEYAQRVSQALEAMLHVGPAAGMLEGGSPEEKAAEAINPLMNDASWTLELLILKELRAKGLAPASGSDLAAYNEAYDSIQLGDLQAALRSLAKDSLSFQDKQHLVRILNQVARVKGDKVADVYAALDTPGEQALALARLAVHMEKVKANPDSLDRAVREAVKRGGNGIDEIVEFYVAAMTEAKAEARAWKTLAALAKQQPEAVRGRVKDLMSELMTDAEGVFPIKQKLIDQGVRIGDYTQRGAYKLIHIDRLRKTIADAAANDGSLSKEQLEVSRRAAEILPLARVAAVNAGVLPGDTPAEVQAEKVNVRLQRGYQKFPGRVFNDELIAAGLAPKTAAVGPDEAYFQSYTKEQLVKLRLFHADWLAKGTTKEGYGGGSRPLDDEEKKILQDNIKLLDSMISGTKLHGMAAGGLALAALGSLGWMPLVVGGLALLAGAWWFWKVWSAPAEAAAAPSLSPDEAVLARYRRIEITAKRLATSVQGGFFRSPYTGSGGTEWAEAKPYQGEDRRDIDWKTTAKKEEVHVKKFEQDRDMPVLLLIDLSASSAVGGRGSKREVIEDSAALLALAAAHSSLRVGAVIFTDKVELYIPPQGGLRHAQDLVRRMMAFEPSGTGTDLRPALQAALKSMGGRAVVPVISDFLSPDFKDMLGAAAKRHDVRPLVVSDPLESKPLPDVGLVRVRDAETGEERLVDTSNAAFRAGQAALARRQREATLQTLLDARLRPIMLSTESDHLETLAEAFRPKAKAQ